ncbi:S8 family serine peptidase [Myxococcota bacterium]|nr:S8 family serine peptidase [Myxococcota bacterium]
MKTGPHGRLIVAALLALACDRGQDTPPAGPHDAFVDTRRTSEADPSTDARDIERDQRRSPPPDGAVTRPSDAGLHSQDATGSTPADASVQEPILPAPPDDLAVEHLPVIPMPPFGEQDYVLNPEFGVVTGRNHLTVTIRDDATVEAVNDVARGAELAGSLADFRILLLRYPHAGTEALNSAWRRLRAHPAVVAAALDLPLSPTWVPPRPAMPPPGPDLPHLDATPFDDVEEDLTWGLQFIGAPAAWGLIPWLETQPVVQRPLVVVADTGLHDHPDLVWDFGPGPTPAWPVVDAHGLTVAGIIGATWNDQYTPGIAPHARLGRVTVANDASSNASWPGMVQALHEACTVSARLVNVSQGYNWYRWCQVDPAGARGVCDPSGQSAVSSCAADIQELIAAAGRQAAALVAKCNAGGTQTLFIVAAGNASGTPEGRCMAAAEPGYCVSASRCSDALGAGTRQQWNCPSRGHVCCPADACRLGVRLGDFPAMWESPLAWAAVAGGVQEDVLVVEALGTGGQRAAFSNVNGGGVFAPGELIWGPTLAPGPSTELVEGTSFAAPMVTGVAAWLLTLEPRLENATLRRLLTEPPFAVPIEPVDRGVDPIAGGGSQTPTAVNMLLATQGLDVMNGNRRYRRAMADVNDETADGFTRVSYGPDGTPLADLTVELVPDGRIDMRDFRRLRDTVLLTFPTVMGTTRVDHVDPMASGLDLNGDGVPLGDLAYFGDDAREGWPRGLLTTAPLLDGTRREWIDLSGRVSSASALAAFGELYDADLPPEGDREGLVWSGADLQNLVASGDVHVKVLGGSVAFGGASMRLDVTIRDPYEVMAPSEDARLRDIRVADEAVLTVPAARHVELGWRALNADGQLVSSGRIEPFELAAGEDRLVTLTPPMSVWGLPRGAASIVAFEATQPFVERAVCANGMAFDVGGRLVTDLLALPDGDFLIASPFDRRLRRIDSATCVDSESLSWGDQPADPQIPRLAGPFALDTTPDGQLVVAHGVGGAPCGPGMVSLVALDPLRVVAEVEIPVGASDVVVLGGDDGPFVLATMPGDARDCPESRLAFVDLARLADANPATDPLSLIPFAGDEWQQMHRIARTRDRAFAALVTARPDDGPENTGSGGRLTFIRASGAELRGVNPSEQPGQQQIDDWDEPTDVAVVREGDGVRAYVTTARSRRLGPTCLQQNTNCGALYGVVWDGAGEPRIRQFAELPFVNPRRLAVTQDRRSAFVAFGSAGHVVRYDLGHDDALLVLDPTPIQPRVESATALVVVP